MSLILATGSNIGPSQELLEQAKQKLSEKFKLLAQSKVYYSKAIEYTNQPDFYNQVLEFALPQKSPQNVLEIIMNIEKELGRDRIINKGPRTIDIDIIFWGLNHVQDSNLTIPHPEWSKRSFVTLPLQELPYFETIKKSFIIPSNFSNSAKALE